MKRYPLVNIPTNALLIDDNIDFLLALAGNINLPLSFLRIFNIPKDAILYINSEFDNSSYLSRYTKEIDGKGFQHRALDIGIYNFPQEVYNDKRFQHLSAVIVDYDMPGMNGLELCASIQDPRTYKVLLTGAADENLAIQAFNEGLINQFISKADANLIEKVKEALLTAHNNYYTSIGDSFSSIILNDRGITALRDPVFWLLFNQLQRQYNIVEYYLFEEPGSFLLIDEEGKTYGLFLYSEQEMIDMAEEAEETPGVDIDIINALKHGKHMFCYHSSGELYFPPMKDRKPYLRPAIKLVGKYNTYYYALTDDIMDIDANNILSFKQYKIKSRREFIE